AHSHAWDCAPTSSAFIYSNTRFCKSLGQVIDHRANASGHEAATWHYCADRYGFAFILRKQSNQPASAKICRSEFVLACDMRFASRENTRLGQPEVGVGVHPGGGTERLPHLVGRGRALEIVLGANDFDGDTAER